MGVYLDHNATSPLRPAVRSALIEALDTLPGNPSSVHGPGRAARAALDNARERIARALGVAEGEILFTSGGTESNNLALRGLLSHATEAPQGPSLVTTATEHPSILRPAEHLAQSGHRVVIVPVDGHGLVNTADLLAAALPAVASADDAQAAEAQARGAQGDGGQAPSAPARLISVCAAGGESAAVPDLPALGAALTALPPQDRPLFHTDATQALGRLPLALDEWGVDLASFSAHKFGGPRGVGILYRSPRAALKPQLLGGEQELGLRPGTENVASIVATAVAVELAIEEQESLARRATAHIALLLELLAQRIPAVRLTGPPAVFDQDGAHQTAHRAAHLPRRLPNTATLLIPGVEGRILATRLDLAGLEASAGSACASGSLEPSLALLAMGYSETDARAGLRLSTGWNTTEEDIHRAVDILWTTLAGRAARR
ncbi:MAG: cysteine desulfurase family protein [Planctomycetota bacterium]|nr:cysteine desulfurase family protein [Planctomycetota bacterium]